MSRTKRFSVILAAGVVGIGAWMLWSAGEQENDPKPAPQQNTNTGAPAHSVVGASVEGRAIESYTFGDGEKHIAFVGGIHGGYEWNTVLLAYRAIDYFTENPDAIPAGVKVTIIPAANPDGLHSVVGTTGRFAAAIAPPKEETTGGRFNARGVDLNRNFACNWQPESTWRGNTVSAGTAVFSEPEAQALRDFVQDGNPDAVIFWHSAADGVYGSECNNGILDETRMVMNAYAAASGYPAIESFDHYEITGDAEGWLASIGIPSVSVELKSHETLEWQENLAGIKALLSHYGK